MGLKILIVVEFIALLLCLSSGFVFLIKDIGIPESKRTLYALGTRVTLAALLMATIGYGIQTGKLKNTAPWGQYKKHQYKKDQYKQGQHKPVAPQENNTLPQDINENK